MIYICKNYYDYQCKIQKKKKKRKIGKFEMGNIWQINIKDDLFGAQLIFDLNKACLSLLKLCLRSTVMLHNISLWKALGGNLNLGLIINQSDY